MKKKTDSKNLSFVERGIALRRKDIVIKRKFLRFLRQHRVEYQLHYGLIIMGSTVIRLYNGRFTLNFPQQSTTYSRMPNCWIYVHWSDCYDTYTRLAGIHNRFIAAFPRMAIRYLPEVEIYPTKRTPINGHSFNTSA